MVMQGVQALTQQVLRLYGIGIAIILGEPCNTVSTEPAYTSCAADLWCLKQ